MIITSLYDPYAIHYDTYADDVYTLGTASITLTAGTLTAADFVLTDESGDGTGVIITRHSSGGFQSTRYKDGVGSGANYFGYKAGGELDAETFVVDNSQITALRGFVWDQDGGGAGDGAFGGGAVAQISLQANGDHSDTGFPTKIIFGVAGATATTASDELVLTDTELAPTTDDGLALGTTLLKFSAAYIKIGYFEALNVDNVNINGNTINATTGDLNLNTTGGTINIDNDWDATGTTCANIGTISAATSITSTTFTDGTATLTGGDYSSTGTGIFGPCLIRAWPSGATLATFSNNALTATADAYALMQKNDGTTYLNAADGKNLYFRVNNSNVGILDPAALLRLFRSSDTATHSPQFAWVRERAGGATVADNDRIGTFTFFGHDGTSPQISAAVMLVNVDGAVATNSVPGEFVFQVKKPTEEALTTAMTIRSNLLVEMFGGLDVIGASTFGDGTDETAISATGDLSFEGNATVWNDMQFQISDAKVTPASLLPSWEAFTTNTSEYAFSVNDEVDTSANEIPHSWKQGTAGNAHMHITTKAVPAQEQKAQFTVTFAYADTGEVWVEVPLTAELTIPIATTALTNFYLDLGDLTLTNYLIEAQMRCRVKRVAKSAGGTEYVGDIFITQVGIHLEEDQVGSKTETAK